MGGAGANECIVSADPSETGTGDGEVILPLASLFSFSFLFPFFSGRARYGRAVCTI